MKKLLWLVFHFKRLLGFGPKIGHVVRHKGKEYKISRIHKPHKAIVVELTREMNKDDEIEWAQKIAPSGGTLKPQLSTEMYHQLLRDAGNNKEAKGLIAKKHWVSDKPRTMTTSAVFSDLRKLPDGRWELPG